MSEAIDDRECTLHALDGTVADAVEYLAEVNPELHGGYQSAREVLCHFVFWHREYVAITRAIVDGRKPTLRSGTYAQLNAGATMEFSEQTMADLACSLQDLQQTLLVHLRAIPDWSADFPVKKGSRFKSVADRVPDIESHLRGHIQRLRRAERLGREWVSAYYPVQD